MNAPKPSRILGVLYTKLDLRSARKMFMSTGLSERKDDLDPPSGPEVAANQMAAFREWEQATGERFANLKNIRQPTLIVNGVHDEMIPVSNSYSLVENLPNAVLLVYPDSGHGSLFQFHESFTRLVTAFLASDSESAGY
jgi:pimeloyl-ACP methyl ester carboxylesterase